MIRHPLSLGGLVLSVGAAYLFLRNLRLEAVLDALTAARPGWLLASTVLFLASVLLRGPRWQRLARDVCDAGTGTVTASLMVGFLANRVLFLRLGELVRCLVLGRRCKASVTGLVATVAVEKVIDLLAVGLCASIALVWWTASQSAADRSAVGASIADHSGLFLAGGVLGLALLILLALWPSVILAAVEAFAARLPQPWGGRLVRVAHASLDGLAALRSVRASLFIYASTACIWGLLLASELCAIQAFQSDMPFLAGLVLMVAIAVGVALPQMPSYVGTFWVAVEEPLQLFGMPEQTAKAAAIALWVVQIVPVAVIGLFCLWWLETSLLAVRREAVRTAEGGAQPEDRGPER